MTTAREEVLARLRTALGPAPVAPAVPRAYRQAGDVELGPEELLDRLTERLTDYRATVTRTTLAELPSVVQAVLARHGARRVVVPPGLPAGWVDQPLVDHGLPVADLDAVDGVVTGCAVAVAETGTIALDASPDQGRRAVTLVPDLHVCVVLAEQVVAGVPDLVARLDPTRPLTLVSGPSATSDIELDRVEGVHGPRRLEVVLVAPPAVTA